MPTYEQFLERQRKQIETKKTENSEQARLLHQVGVAMSGIKSDPRWKLYADHLTGLKEFKEKALSRLTLEIFNVSLKTDDIQTLRVKIHGHQQYILALTESIDLVSRLIDKGEAAKLLIKEETDA